MQWNTANVTQLRSQRYSIACGVDVFASYGPHWEWIQNCANDMECSKGHRIKLITRNDANDTELRKRHGIHNTQDGKEKDHEMKYEIMGMYLNPMHYLKSHKCQEICKSRKIMYIAQTDADGTDTHECMKMTQMQQNDSDATKLCRRH